MPSVQKTPQKHVQNASLVLLLACCLLYGLRLGALDLWAPDEPRYGAIAEELRALPNGAQDLILLRLNGEPYTQKPPLYFWIAAAFGAPAGHVGELAARLPSALAAVASVALTILIARWALASPLLALWAGALLATSFRFAFTARRAQLDVLLTACELAAIAIFACFELRGGGIERIRGRKTAIAAFHAALGAAALVKGPVGWLPLAVIAGYLAWQGRLGALRALTPGWGFLLSVGPVLAWITTATLLAPAGFADVAVVENLAGRFFSGTSHARPFYYYLYQTPVDFLPWTPLLIWGLPAVWRSAQSAPATPRGPGTRRPGARFLIAWVGVAGVFFSLSAGKRGVYLLPVFPALAMLAASGLGRLYGDNDSTGGQDDAPRERERMRPRRRLLGLLAGVAAIELILFTVALPMLDNDKSPRPIARSAAAATAESEAVGVYGMSPLEGGLGYYGNRPIASLRDEPALRGFLGTGGRVVVMRARHFEALAAELSLEAIGRFRSGRRGLVVARPRDTEPLGESPLRLPETGMASP